MIPVLRVVVQNNDVVAENVVTRLLIFEESLDPIIEPVYDGIEEDANPVGPNRPLNVVLPIDPKWNMYPLFVVLQVQYTGSLSGKTYSQPFFLKYATGKQFSRADMDEKTRIERYMKERGIPLL